MTVVNLRDTADETESLQARARELSRAQIEFIPNAEFRVDESILDESIQSILAAADSTESHARTETSSRLTRMCRSELLTHEQESALFRKMNLLRFQADGLRSQLNPEQPDEQIIAAIESRLAMAQRIRDHLIKANVRLAISIVKKYVTPQRSFDEMLSDGTLTLMQAVDKFDDLADKLGVSKERARQLEIRAVKKLKAMVADFDVDELFGAAMV